VLSRRSLPLFFDVGDRYADSSGGSKAKLFRCQLLQISGDKPDSLLIEKMNDLFFLDRL